MEAEHDPDDWTGCWTCSAWWQDVMRPGARHATIEEWQAEMEMHHRDEGQAEGAITG